MAENRSQFAIQIKTILEDAGIKATDEQLSKVGKNVENLNTQLGQNKDAHNEAGKAGAEAGEKQAHAAHEAGLSHRELRESVRAVAAQFGGLADVGLWLNPMTAALAATLFLVDKFKEALALVDEAAVHLAESTEAIHDAKLKALADAAASAAEAFNALDIAADKLDAAYARGDAAITARIAQYAAEQDALLKLEEAKEQAFEAEIHRQEALGRITKEHGDQLIADAKLRLESTRDAGDAAKLGKEIEERQKELAAAQQRLASGKDANAVRAAKHAEEPLAGSAAAASEAATQAEKSPFLGGWTDWRGNSQTWSGNVEELKKKITEQRLGQQNAEADPNSDSEIAERYKKDGDALQEVLDRQEAYIANLKRIEGLEKEKLTRAQGATGIASDQLTHDQELERTGQARIDTLQRQLDLLQRTNAAVEHQHRQTANTNASTEHIETVQRLLSGQGTPLENAEAQDQATRHAAATQRGPRANADAYTVRTQAEEILYRIQTSQRGRGGPQDLADVHALNERILGHLENAQTAGGNNLAALHQRLDQLERNLYEQQTHTNNLQNQINTNR